MTTPVKITSELQKLAPSAIIEMFILDLTSLGDTVYRFHAGSNGYNQDVVWQGNLYVPFPVEASGFEYNGQGQLPRPVLRVANLSSAITLLALQFKDLIGAKVTRKRTLRKYLDAANFPGGNATADPTADFEDEIYYIDRKANENRDVVEFELATSFDLQGVLLPRRQIIQNICSWAYKGTECGYAGTNYFDVNDDPVGSSSLDACGKRLSSCQARFGTKKELPFGGFPAAAMQR
jgi:lambda family phage minor tail protein L